VDDRIGVPQKTRDGFLMHADRIRILIVGTSIEKLSGITGMR
jgi:hypothetical protein